MDVRQIITSALRKAVVVASGETPSADEMNDGLEMLQALVLEHPGLAGGYWRDLYPTSSTAFTAKEGQRITVGAFSPVITLPTTTTDWECTRAMAPLARIQIVGGDQEGLWLYSTEWRRADALTLDSENPFGDVTNNGLAAQLAARWVEEFGTQVGPSNLAQAQRSEKTIRGRLYRRPDYWRSVFWDDFTCGGDYD